MTERTQDEARAILRAPVSVRPFFAPFRTWRTRCGSSMTSFLPLAKRR
jgi:hypothetical protein